MASQKKTTTAKKTAGKKRSAKAAKAAAKKTTAKAAAKKTASGAGAETGAGKQIEARIRELGDWRGTRLAEIRSLIHEVDPNVLEEWKWRGTPVWSHDGMYANANAHKDKVKITFLHGAQLRDPAKLFNAGLEGNQWRAIDLHEGDRIDQRALKALLREAIAYNESHSVPRSRGSNA